ncbi:hypothetical protein [Pseudobacter ginsenosidimutans]|uniref:Uncharacterized protein n=1 Tax=Pseudobacter ginsenosidimutans TaxID=661488 RepID=A0A4Q7MBY8_9BACT|nr:hypothetical protein [Pseudobacter ginsenosidimutans]QEC45215.1 hypothetical protein FSB84_27295 [Pseudobacter ginsenosidimutans]RZS65484.1 hypothetical protein EV199_5657 [Pseudobacter ginsenosidimutans]
MTAIKNANGFLMFLLLLTLIACKKEAALQPGNKEEYQLTIKDNPSDPVDHAIYQFYQATGIPVYYNDTIAREKVGDTAGVPLYKYHRLAIGYSPLGTQVSVSRVLLPDKTVMLSMLPFLKDKLLPQLENVFTLQSLFVVKSSTQRLYAGLTGRANKPFLGFNTLMINYVNPAELSDSAQRRYIGAALAIIAYMKFRPAYANGLTAEFNKISQSTTAAPVVFNVELSTLSPDGNGTLEDFSFLPLRFVPQLVLLEGLTPTPEMDFLAYLEAVFYYNKNPSADFETEYAAYPPMIKKFRLTKKILQGIGFSISD